MDPNVILRSGKYQGYTVGEVWHTDPGYIRWIKENRPEMLRSHAPKAKPVPQKAPQMSEEDMESYNWNKNIRPATPEEAF